MKIISQLSVLIAGLFLAANLGAQPVLKTVFQNDFLIGAALNPAQFCESNTMEAALVKRQFNTISPENVLKWEWVHPELGHFDFTLADRYVGFGETNGMVIIGHTLVWHSQTPDWVFQDGQGKTLTRDALLARMREHILAVVGRYKGRIKAWDVVNEAIDEDGSLRSTPWRKIIGDDYLVKAFQFAHEADPQAELNYNDYGLENAEKRAGAVALVKKLQAAGVPLNGVGLQGHYKLKGTVPSPAEVDAAIADFAKLGLKVMITELDVDVLPAARESLSADVNDRRQADARMNPFPQNLPMSVQKKLAARYAELFAVFLNHRSDITRVTFWGVTDADSWLNDWPVSGRTSYPLLFDREGKPKPALISVISLAHKSARVTDRVLADSTLPAPK